MSKSLRSCPQEKCAFKQLGLGCRECEVCKCSPFIIDDNCDKCWNCAFDEGILRWDDNKNTDLEQEADKKSNKEKLNVIEVKT